ncbi:MAG: AraC family transcriptional regulator [Clostridiales bacterium]|jgi:YesN/AraC family two-component response regulator|nr:AraC family transcriptional regulator [Clostridiales bacterium]
MYNLLDVGTYHKDKLPRCNCQFWEFIQLTQGQCVFSYQNDVEDIVLQVNEMIAIPPLTDYKLMHDNALQANYIQIEHIILPSNQSFKVGISPNNILEDIFKHCIYFNNTKHNFNSAVLYSIVDLFLSCIVEFATIKRLSPIVEKIYMAIHRHYTDANFSIKDILKHKKGNSYDYLRRLFKKEIGISPTQLIRKLQIEYATRLIIHSYKSKLNLSQISIECGIVDQYYFSRLFKQHTGVGPQQYISNLSNGKI